MDEFSLGWTLGTETGPYFSTTATLTTKSFLLPEFLDQNFTWKQLKHILKMWLLLFYVFSPLHVRLLPEEMIWREGEAGLKLRLSFAKPGRLGILAMIPINIQGLDSKGSSPLFSKIHARVGIMQLDILAIAVFLELQLYVSWSIPRQTCSRTPCPGNPVPFLVDIDLLLKV